VWDFFRYHCHITLNVSIVVRVHCIVVYLHGSVFVYRRFHNLNTVLFYIHRLNIITISCLHLHSGESHMWERKKRKKRKYRSCRKVCVVFRCVCYCSEAWVSFCVWWWFPLLECSGMSAVRVTEGGSFTDGGSL